MELEDDGVFESAIQAAIRQQGAEQEPIIRAVAEAVRHFLINIEHISSQMERLSDSIEGGVSNGSEERSAAALERIADAQEVIQKTHQEASSESNKRKR
jgi:hypothetical protein